MNEGTGELLRAMAEYSDMDPQDARMLPPAAYLSDELFEIEMERIFRHEWICVGREEQLRKPGDYFTIELLEEPMVVVRGPDGRLRALSNVCRHRYMKVAAESGNTGLFVCPYHKWTYELDGQLRAAPGMEDNRTFDAQSCRLPEFRLETWLGFIFVTLDDTLSPLSERLASIAERFSAYGLNEWRTAAWYDEIWNGNWKLSCENGMDSYHHMGLHAETAEPMMPALGTYFVGAHEHWVHHRTPILADRASAMGVDLDRYTEGLPEEDRATMNAAFIYPNLVFPAIPGQLPWLSILPIDRTHSRIISGLTVSPRAFEGVEEGEYCRESNENLHKLNTEDSQGTWRLQSVLASRRIERGPISAKERCVFYFYRYLAEMLAGVTPN